MNVVFIQREAVDGVITLICIALLVVALVVTLARRFFGGRRG